MVGSPIISVNFTNRKNSANLNFHKSWSWWNKPVLRDFYIMVLLFSSLWVFVTIFCPKNACTCLVPTVFRWHGKINKFKCHLHFSFSHDIEKQIWILMRVPWCQPFFDDMGKWIQMSFTFFVFAWHWRTDLNFACCFSFSLNFEKRIWTSYFFFRFRFTLKNGYGFHFSLLVFASLWKTDLNFVFRFCITCYWKTDWSFVCHFCMNLKSGLMHQSFETRPRPTPPPPFPRGRPG